MAKEPKHAVQMQKKFRAASPVKTFKRILSYLRPYRGRMIFAIICMLANVVANIAGTYMLSIAINNYILPLAVGEYVSLGVLNGINALGGFVGIMAAIYVTGAFLHYIMNYIIVSATTKILEDIRNEMFEKMEKLPIRYFDTHTHGDLMSLYTNDTDTLRELLSSGLPNILTNV